MFLTKQTILEFILIESSNEFWNGYKDDNTVETHTLSKIEKDFLNKHFHKSEKILIQKKLLLDH